MSNPAHAIMALKNVEIGLHNAQQAFKLIEKAQGQQDVTKALGNIRSRLKAVLRNLDVLLPCEKEEAAAPKVDLAAKAP